MPSRNSGPPSPKTTEADQPPGGQEPAGRDRILVAQLTGVARHHARWRPLIAGGHRGQVAIDGPFGGGFEGLPNGPLGRVQQPVHLLPADRYRLLHRHLHGPVPSRDPQTEVDVPGFPPGKQLIAEIRRLLAGQGGGLQPASSSLAFASAPVTIQPTVPKTRRHRVASDCRCAVSSPVAPAPSMRTADGTAACGDLAERRHRIWPRCQRGSARMPAKLPELMTAKVEDCFQAAQVRCFGDGVYLAAGSLL